MKFWPFKRQVKEHPAGAILVWNPGQPAFTDRNLDAFAQEGYIKNAVAFASIRKRMVSVASIDMQVCRQADGEQVTIDQHPLIDLLKRPNPTQGWDSFIMALSGYFDITGNAYILRSPPDTSRPPDELWLLKPSAVKVITGTQGMPLAYEVKGQSGSVTYDVDQITGVSDILHIKSFHPANMWYGLSPLDPAAYNVDTFNAAQKWNKKLLDNDAKPSGAFIMQGKESDGAPASMSDDQYNRLKEQIETQISGAANAGRPLLLEGGLDWKEMSMTMHDMDYRESVLMSARWIASCYGVPPQMIGIPGENKFANYEQAQLDFWMNTILPHIDMILTELNHWLAPMFGDGIFIKYDKDAIPALEPRRQQLFERLNANTFMTPNEKREIAGLDPIEGGDQLLVEATKIPIGSVDLFNTDVEDGDEEGKAYEQNGQHHKITVEEAGRVPVH